MYPGVWFTATLGRLNHLRSTSLSLKCSQSMWRNCGNRGTWLGITPGEPEAHKWLIEDHDRATTTVIGKPPLSDVLVCQSADDCQLISSIHSAIGTSMWLHHCWECGCAADAVPPAALGRNLNLKLRFVTKNDSRQDGQFNVHPGDRPHTAMPRLAIGATMGQFRT